MSDFDNIINDRLNEDDGEFFPHREANWDKMSQRLAAFEAANPLPDADDMPKTPLTLVWKRWAWASAAATLVGVSSLLFWHFNKVQSLEQRYADLEQKFRTNKVDTILGAKTTLVQIDTIYRTQKTIIEHLEPQQSNRIGQTPEIPNKGKVEMLTIEKRAGLDLEQKQANRSNNKQNAGLVDTQLPHFNTQLAKQNRFNEKRQGNDIAKINNKNNQNPLPFDNKNIPLDEQKKQLNVPIVHQAPPSVFSGVSEANPLNKGQNTPNQVVIAPKEGETTIQAGQKSIDKIEQATQTPSSPIAKGTGVAQTVVDSVLNKNKETKAPETNVALTEIPKTDSSSKANTLVQNENKNNENTPPPTIIPTGKGKKTLKSFLPKGFAIGLEGFYGSELPDVRGIKPTIGKGISAELKLTKNISLAASADLLETHFELGERPKNFQVKNEPNPPKPNVGLHRIRGEQHSRLLSLSAKYVFKQKWWVQPSIAIGHSWQKVEGYPVNFVFKDFSTEEETLVPVQTETERIKRLWQATVGLEKRIKRFTFGVSAEVQKDFSMPTTPTGQALASSFGILRGGVKFNIF